MNSTEQIAKLLELTMSELAIPLKVTHAGRTYRLRHILRPPTPTDWFAYEAGLEMAVEELPPAADSDEPGFRLHVRSADAALVLWERLAQRVEGYDLPGHSRPSGHDFSRAETIAEERAGELPAGSPGSQQAGWVGTPPANAADWRTLIPLAHKEAAVNALTLVAPAQPHGSPNNKSTNNYFPLLADEVPIVLEAVVAGAAYPRLVHRFRPPTVEAERAYRRLLAETLIVRGSRTPRTLLPPRLPGLVKLYDQLILGVEGYARNGQPLGTGSDAARHVDAWHKRAAVQALFGDLLTPHLDEQASDIGGATPEATP